METGSEFNKIDSTKQLDELAKKLIESHPNIRTRIYKTDQGSQILDVYLGFSGLDFSINESGKLELVTERWYKDKASHAEHSGLEIGEPTIDNLSQTIDLFQEKGRSCDESDKSVKALLSTKLTIDEYISILVQKNYKIDSDELKLLTDRLVDLSDFDHNEIFNKIGDRLNEDNPHYQATVFQDDGKMILDVYTSFSRLQFTINKSGRLVLVKENWYSRGSIFCKHEIEIGKPSLSNVIKTIDLFIEKGRANNESDESMADLIQKHKSDFI